METGVKYIDTRYEVVEENEDPKQSIIRKHGTVIDLTLQEIEDHKKRLEKLDGELDATIKVSEAKLKNIEEHHPYVKEATPEQLNAYFMYYREMEYLHEVATKKDENTEQLKLYADETVIINDLLGKLVDNV